MAALLRIVAGGLMIERTDGPGARAGAQQCLHDPAIAAHRGAHERGELAVVGVRIDAGGEQVVDNLVEPADVALRIAAAVHALRAIAVARFFIPSFYSRCGFSQPSSRAVSAPTRCSS